MTPKQVPDVDEEDKSAIDDGGARDSSTASSDVNDSGLDVDTGESEIVADEPDAAERTTPSSRPPQIIAFSSSDHLKICGSIRLPQTNDFAFVFRVNECNSVRMPANDLTLPPLTYVIDCSHSQFSFQGLEM